jgi:PAS domain S-box-containing protein
VPLRGVAAEAYSSAVTKARKHDFLNDAAEVAAIAAVYFLVAKASLEFASLNPSATPIWPPTGLALGVILLRGHRLLPAIFLGALLANATTAGGLPASTAIAAGNTLEAFVGAFLINRWAGGAAAFQTPYGIGQFAVIVAAASTPVSASIGVAALSLAGSASLGDLPAIWATWWLGDAAGAVMVAPAVVLWSRALRQPANAQRTPHEGIALHAFAIVIGAVAFSPLLPSAPGRNALSFLAVLPLLWTALRRGPRDTSTVALILSAFAVWGTAAGEGPFTQATLNASFLLLVSFVASVTIPSLALSAAVASRDHALAEHELAVRAGEIGIWDWDLRSNEMTYSEQAKSIFGFPVDAAVTYEQVRDATHPDDLPNTSAMARRALDPQLRERQPYEYRIRRGDGEVRWLIAHGHAVFDGAKAVRYLGTIQDITERKIAEEHLQLLIRELNHRVKNTLAVVQSISAQTFRSTNDPRAAAASIEGRLQALARAHDILTSESWRGADFGQLIQASVAPYTGSDGDRLLLRGPPVMVPPGLAVSVSMIFHELATNALKYGSLSVEGGHVEVAWQRRAGAEGTDLSVTWSERGGPAAKPPSRHGFGLSMIERSAAAELCGGARVAFEPSGFTCDLTIQL